LNPFRKFETAVLQNEVRKAAGIGFGKPGFVHNETK